MTNATTEKTALAPQVCRHCKGWSSSRRCGCDEACIERGEPTHSEKMATIKGFAGSIEVW